MRHVWIQLAACLSLAESYTCHCPPFSTQCGMKHAMQHVTALCSLKRGPTVHIDIAAPSDSGCVPEGSCGQVVTALASWLACSHPAQAPVRSTSVDFWFTVVVDQSSSKARTIDPQWRWSLCTCGHHGWCQRWLARLDLQSNDCDGALSQSCYRCMRYPSWIPFVWTRLLCIFVPCPAQQPGNPSPVLLPVLPSEGCTGTTVHDMQSMPCTAHAEHAMHCTRTVSVAHQNAA